jgi:pimeloyl-ACP methyl ester carboxylesterase
VVDAPSAVTLGAEVGGAEDGPTVMLMYGGGPRGAWKKAASALAAGGYRVVSLDLRGHGESDGASDGDYSLDTFAATSTRLPRPGGRC